MAQGVPRARSHLSWKELLPHSALLAGSLVMFLPFFWMLTTSLKTYMESIKNPPQWLPALFQWQNYVQVWALHEHFGRYFLNSFIIAIVTVTAEVILSIFAAYAFSKMKFIGKNILFVIFISTMMIPGEVLLVPNYVTLAQLKWINTFYALIVPWVVSVFAIFLLRQHFLQIPEELREAAFLDGAGHMRFLFQIVVPLSRPPLATVALLKFIGSWNAFLWPMLVTTDPAMRTVPVGLNSLIQDAGADYQLLMAGATVALIPVVLIFLLAQKQFLASVARSGLKG